MIQFGFSLGFAGLSNYAAQQTPQPAAQDAPQPTHTATNSTMMVAAAPMYPVAMMSPAYMMAYPQMAGPMGMAPMAGAPAAAGAVSQGAHVTANPTNAMAANSPATAGYGGYGGVGSFAGFGMPVMMMSPVFMAMGYPVVFQGSVAQPPVGNAPVAEEVQPPAVETPTPVEVPEVVAPPPVNTEGAVVDVVPPSKEQAQSLPSLPITELGAEDFAKYRSVEKSKQQETSLSLSLTTQDGDQISLNFSQIDAMEMSRFRGRTLDGDRVKDSSFREESERIVNMDVVGDLTDAEKAAVDGVMSTIIEVVNSFFTGEVGQAVEKLKQMDFDGDQLAELSLNMSMSKSAVVNRAYHNGDDAMHMLKNRDADVDQALEFIATEQKRLVDIAKALFDAPSAAKLVRSLVPPLMSEPFSKLNEQIAAAGVDVLLETTSDDVEDAEDDN